MLAIVILFASTSAYGNQLDPKTKMGILLRQRFNPQPNGHINYTSVFTDGAPWQGNSGEKKILTLMVEFPDEVHRVKKELYEDVWLSKTRPGIIHYYDIVSNSKLNVTLGSKGVGDWLMMPKSYRRYIIDNDYSEQKVVDQIIKDSLKTVSDKGIDISEYDKDNNGLPDFTVYFLAGNSMSANGYMLGDFTYTNEKQTVVMVAEDYRAGEYNSPTLIHEMAHAIVPIWDLYDYSYTSYPVKGWDIMGAGSWEGYCGMSSFTRWKAGWIDLEWLDKPGDYNVDDLNGDGTHKVYGIQIPGSDKEWLLVECRFKTGLDSFFNGIPSEGLAVYIVDDKRPYDMRFNTLTKDNQTHGFKFIKCLRPSESLLPESNPGTSPYVKVDKTTPNLGFRNVSREKDGMVFTLTHERPKFPVISVPSTVYCGKVVKNKIAVASIKFTNIGIGTMYVLLQSKTSNVTLDRESFIGNDELINATIDASGLKLGKNSALISFLNKSTEANGLITLEFEVTPIHGDLDSNDRVNSADLVEFKKYYGMKGDQPGFKSEADFNCDGVIDINDLFMLAKNYSGR